MKDMRASIGRKEGRGSDLAWWPHPRGRRLGYDLLKCTLIYTCTLLGLGCFPAPGFVQSSRHTKPTFHNGASSAAAPMGAIQELWESRMQESLPRPGLPTPTLLSPGFCPPDRGSWTLCHQQRPRLLLSIRPLDSMLFSSA